MGIIEPYKGRVCDPCCGSGGMFVQSKRFVEEHQARKDDIHIFGQEFTAATWKLCKMDLAIRSIDGNLGERDADTFPATGCHPLDPSQKREYTDYHDSGLACKTIFDCTVPVELKSSFQRSAFLEMENWERFVK